MNSFLTVNSQKTRKKLVTNELGHWNLRENQNQNQNTGF